MAYDLNVGAGALLFCCEGRRTWAGNASRA